jgi:7-cyano-7-deazaguanine synthase
MEKRTKKAVVLFSGGADSTVTLFFALSKGYDCTALVFDYGQRHAKETKFAVARAKALDVPYHVVKIAMPWGGSALTDKGIDVPANERLDRKGVPVTYVPGRNSVFLSFAFSCAEAVGAREIFIGAHVQDYSGYPDCRPAYLAAMETAVNSGLACGRIKLRAPLIDLDKTGIIRLGLKLGVDFSKTWSCYNGGKKPCGECDSCRYRIRAFGELGMSDPAL